MEAPSNLGTISNADSPNIVSVRRRIDQLSFQRKDALERLASTQARIDAIKSYLQTADKVSAALEILNQELFSNLLRTVESKITIALQEILEQPISFHAEVGFQRNSACVNFWIERNGKAEDLLQGQGGSVANIVSVCLRLFALTTLDEKRHRRFLVLDEQDCWLRADLVPKLVKIIHDASRALGFQILMISHHDRQLFDQYADKVLELQWHEGTVRCIEVASRPVENDHSIDQQDAFPHS